MGSNPTLFVRAALRSDSRVRTLEQNKTLCFCLADVKDILARHWL